jgi:phytoene desaturase
MASKVVIVGAGPGGLAAAMLLAGKGADVTVLEKQPRVGGRTSAIESSGFRFDVGPTFFLYPQVLENIFAAVGRDLHQEVQLERLSPQYRLTFGGGGQLDASADVQQMAAEIDRFAPGEGGGFRRFMADNRVKLDKFTPCLQSPFLSWASLLDWRLMAVFPYLKPWRSLYRELSRYFRDERLRLAFTLQSKYLGMSPFQCPSLFSILSFLEYEYGVYHPIGGCNALTAAMARVAAELGCDIRLAEPVEQLLFESRRAVGVRTNRAEVRADAVVLNADFAHAMKALVPASMRRRWTDRRIDSRKYSCSTFMMYLGLEGDCDSLAHHNIRIARDYRGNLADIENRHRLSEDPSFYVQNACVTDPSLAPAGHSTLYVLVPVSHEHPSIDWHAQRARYRSLALRKLEELGVEDVERRIRFERILTPDDWREELDIYRGATFNLSHNLRQMLHLRPRNRFEEFERVYLVGGGTHPGSGLPVIFESARITSDLLLKDVHGAGRDS